MQPSQLVSGSPIGVFPLFINFSQSEESQYARVYAHTSHTKASSLDHRARTGHTKALLYIQRESMYVLYLYSYSILILDHPQQRMHFKDISKYTYHAYLLSASIVYVMHTCISFLRFASLCGSVSTSSLTLRSSSHPAVGLRGLISISVRTRRWLARSHQRSAFVGSLLSRGYRDHELGHR